MARIDTERAPTVRQSIFVSFVPSW